MCKRVAKYKCPECGGFDVYMIEANYWNWRVQEWANTRYQEDTYNCIDCGWSGETEDDLDVVYFEEDKNG